MWYEVTRWPGTYDDVPAVPAPGVPAPVPGPGPAVTTTGRDAYVYEAFQLFEALEDQANARITVMRSFVLSSNRVSTRNPKLHN